MFPVIIVTAIAFLSNVSGLSEGVPTDIEELLNVLENYGPEAAKPVVSKRIIEEIEKLDSFLGQSSLGEAERGFTNEMKLSWESLSSTLQSIDPATESRQVISETMKTIILKLQDDSGVFHQGLEVLRSSIAHPTTFMSPEGLPSFSNTFDVRIVKHVIVERLRNEIENLVSVLNRWGTTDLQRRFVGDILNTLRALKSLSGSIQITETSIIQGYVANSIGQIVTGFKKAADMFNEGFELLGSISWDHLQKPAYLNKFIGQYNPLIIKYIVDEELNQQIKELMKISQGVQISERERFLVRKSIGDVEYLKPVLDSMGNDVDGDSRDQANSVLRFIVGRLVETLEQIDEILGNKWFYSSRFPILQ